MNQVLGGNECEKLSHTHNNNHRLQKLTKRSKQSDKQSEQCSVPPKGPFLTDSWSWMKSSARHTLSNRGLSEIQLRLVNLTENAVCHTFKGSLFVALRMLLQLTYCSFNNHCEY